jgi:hypothetical protein
MKINKSEASKDWSDTNKHENWVDAVVDGLLHDALAVLRGCSSSLFFLQLSTLTVSSVAPGLTTAHTLCKADVDGDSGSVSR